MISFGPPSGIEQLGIVWTWVAVVLSSDYTTMMTGYYCWGYGIAYYIYLLLHKESINTPNKEESLPEIFYPFITVIFI